MIYSYNIEYLKQCIEIYINKTGTTKGIAKEFLNLCNIQEIEVRDDFIDNDENNQDENDLDYGL